MELYSTESKCGYVCGGTKAKFDMLLKLHKKKCEYCNNKLIGEMVSIDKIHLYKHAKMETQEV